MTRRPQLLRFAREERGAIAVFAAVIFPLFILILGLVVDFSRAAVTKNELQIAADASALAGAAFIKEDDAVILAEANVFAEHNMPLVNNGDVLLDQDIEIGNWDNDARVFTAGGAPRNAVRTTTRRQGSYAMQATGFSALAGITAWNLTSQAIAVNGVLDTVNYCMMALNETDPQTLLIQGSSTITAEDCDIQVNSCDDQGMKIGGSDITIDMQGMAEESGSINICGDYSVDGWPNVDYNAMNTDGDVQDDPFDEIDQPADEWFDDASDCSANNYQKSLNGGETFTFNLTPTYSDTNFGDVYVMCGGMKINGEGTFVTKPGTYIIKDGPLLVEGNTALDGSAGQTFYMTGANSYASFGGQADMTLRGLQLEGSPFEGFAVYGDPDNLSTQENIIRGTNATTLDGIVYLPGRSLRLTGTSGTGLSAVSDCAVLVADRFTIAGTPDLGLVGTCSGYANADAFTEEEIYLRLVN